MVRVLFVCYGNICRSPMAEYVFKKMVDEEGLSTSFEIASKAVSREEIGNDIYPPAKKILDKYNVPYDRHYASQITIEDYEYYDYFIGMDTTNINMMVRMFDGDKEHKVYRLMDFTDNKKDIKDPWYTGDFETTYQDIIDGCKGLLEYINE